MSIRAFIRFSLMVIGMLSEFPKYFIQVMNFSILLFSEAWKAAKAIAFSENWFVSKRFSIVLFETLSSSISWLRWFSWIWTGCSWKFVIIAGLDNCLMTLTFGFSTCSKVTLEMSGLGRGIGWAKANLAIIGAELGAFWPCGSEVDVGFEMFWLLGLT